MDEFFKMSKEIAKMKEEMKAEFLKLKEEMKAELKEHREALERQFRSELRELKAEQQSLTQSLEFAHETIEDLTKKLDAETAKNAGLASENAALERTLQDLEGRLVHLEQYSRKANLEIQGVIRKDDESVSEILSKVGSAINEPIADSDIEACHRVPTRNADRSHIIVQFKSKAKKTRLTNNDLGLENTAPVYVNEHLCPALKKLLVMAVKRKHEYHWKSVWSHNGKIFAKQTDDSPIVSITNENDIGKISAKQAASNK